MIHYIIELVMLGLIVSLILRVSQLEEDMNEVTHRKFAR